MSQISMVVRGFCLFIVAWWSLFLPVVSAEERAVGDSGSVRAMSFDEALDHARSHHPSIRARLHRVHAAAAEIRAVHARWAPQVGAMGQWVASTTNNSSTTLLSTSAVDLPRIGATTIDGQLSAVPAMSSAVAVGLRQELFDFGRTRAEAHVQELLRELTQQRATEAELDVEYALTQAYYTVIGARAILDASRAAERRARVHGEFARAAVEKGLRPAIELARTQADLARFEVGALRAEAGLHAARAMYAAAAAVSDEELDVAGDEPRWSELPALSELFRESEGRDPGVLAARALAGAQYAREAALASNVRPRIYASASVSARAGGSPDTNGPVPTGSGWLPAVPNWHAGVVMTWPLFDAVNQRQREAARDSARAFDAEADDVARTRRARVTAAYYAAKQAELSIGAVQRAFTAAAANHRFAEERFRVGLTSSVELSDAETLRLETEIELAIAQSTAFQRRAELLRALGESNDPR